MRPILPERLHGRPVPRSAISGSVTWMRRSAYLSTIRQVGTPVAERVEEMSYVELQSIADEHHRHGKRRYAKGHYLTELSDAAIDAYLSRGVPPRVRRGPADPGRRAPSQRRRHRGHGRRRTRRSATVRPWSNGEARRTGSTPVRTTSGSGRPRVGRGLEPFSTGMYVNTIADEGQAGVRRAYTDASLTAWPRSSRYDPDNVFHLNHNINPAAQAVE